MGDGKHLKERYATAYLEMAKHTGYRPARRETPQTMEDEAKEYALWFYNKEEHDEPFVIGRSDNRSNRAFSWAVEAAQLCCGGSDQMPIAITLFKMAADELAREYNIKPYKNLMPKLVPHPGSEEFNLLTRGYK